MWKKPEFSKKQINEAGAAIVNPNVSAEDYAHAIDIIDNWRAAHAYPMHIFAINLRRTVSDIEGAVVVQRLKRLDTICGKLVRFPKMNLYRMQDLGGCRVIVPKIDDVYNVKRRLEHSRIRHERKEPKDYIETPNPKTGYRGVHLIYKYKSEKTNDYNGLLIEIQIRTKLQHLWATAVETVGVFTGNGLKFNQGSERWLEFFKLISALFSVEEGTHIVDGTPSNIWQLMNSIVQVEQELDAINKMRTIGYAVQQIGHLKKRNSSGYYLLKLDVDAAELSISTFEGVEKGLDEATEEYNAIEKNKGSKNIDAVLVSAQSYESLVDAYPNYFANISEFINTLLEIIQKNIDSIRDNAQEEAYSSV